jgi:putative ABC transport system permease protein
MRLALYRTLSLRYLRRRWSRAAMITASIALGVATLVATQALNLSMSTAAQVAGRPLAGLADLHVGNGDAGVARELAAELAAVAGVRSVMPVVVERVLLPDLGNRPALLVGVELSLDRLTENPWGIEYRVTNPWQAVQQGRRSMFVGSQLAADLSRASADEAPTFRVMAAGRLHAVPSWVGTVDARGPAAALGGNVVYMEIGAAAEFIARPGVVSRIDLQLNADADRESVRANAAEVLRGRAKVEAPEDQAKSIHEAMAGLQIGFSVCGAGALVIGLFLVYNVLSVSVSERRHEIGILRSVGATRGQVWALFVGEAGLLGLVGAALGVPLGIGLARLGLGPMQHVFRELFMDLEAREVVVTAATLIMASAGGLVTALLAALVPAVRASAEEPADAVRRIPPRPTLSHRVLQISVSVVLVVAGLAFMYFRTSLPHKVGTHAGLILILLGLLLLTPLFAAVLARLIQPLASRYFGIEGRLAADNLVRAPARTGLVITALAAGVAMVLQTAGVICSNERVILRWLDESIKADLFVTSGSPVSGSGTSVPIREQVGREIAASDARIEAVLAVRFQKVDFGDKKIFLIALDAQGFHEASRKRGAVARLELYQRLAEPGVPGVLVSDNFAALYGVKEGDVISIRGPRGPVELLVRGSVEDYSWNLGTLIVDRSLYQKQFEDSLVDVLDVYLRPGVDHEAVREQLLRRWGPEHALVVLTREELRDRVQGIIHRLYDIAYSQEVVVGIVAALGVVTALLISVMQRRSEIGTLRAIGATRGQVLRSVLAEAALMGCIGTFIGLLVGVPIEWYILQVVLFEEAGFRFAVSIPWREAAVIAGVALATATLAGLGPALQTLRLRIPEAIAYE